MIRLFEVVKDIEGLVKKLAYGITTESRVKRFSNDQNLNLKNEGASLGVRHFTLRNLGKSIIYVSTGSADEREPVNPDETFTINSPHRVADQSVKITFGAEHPDYVADATRSSKDAIVRFLVDIC